MPAPRPRTLDVLPVQPGDRTLELLPVLATVLAGRGPALHPVAAGSVPHPALAVGDPLGAEEDDPADPTAFVVATSGSTGTPKGALLPVGALTASADATRERLGGPGRWVLALPAHHVAGLQVLLRSVQDGTEPVVLPTGPFSPAAFEAATARCEHPRRYTSLVPTQLVRLLDAGTGATAALAAYDAVLVGAAATPAPLLARARAAGVRVVTTYGSSETCGGCVYDGRPLAGVRPAVDAAGRLSLTGPVVARGYRGLPHHPAFTAAPGEEARTLRTFRTDDSAVVSPDGLVAVTGRVDDLITTGGLKVAPTPVEDALLGVPGVAEAVVVGVADPEWGQRVVAAVVPSPGAAVPTLDRLRGVVARVVAPHAAPRQLLLLDALPLRGPGKPDRRRIAELAAAGEPPRAPVRPSP